MAVALSKIDAIIDEIDKYESKSDSSDCRFTLAYWKQRGLADPIRMMFIYSNTKYNNIMYDTYKTTNKDNEVEWDHSEWLDIKYKLNLSFPNLPYLLDHKTNLRLTESQAILRYLGRVLNIGPSNDPQLAMSEMIGDIIQNNIRWPYILFAYQDLMTKRGGISKDNDDNKCYYDLNLYLKEKLYPQFDLLNKWLTNKKWLVGDNLSYPDFHLYSIIDQNMELQKDCLQNYGELQRFYNQFNKLQFMQQWETSGLGKLRCNNNYANYSNKHRT